MDEVLEERVLEIFRYEPEVLSGLPFNLSPEIATFAVEYLIAQRLSISEVAARLAGDKELAVLAELLRTARSKGYDPEFVRGCWQYLRNPGDERIKAAIAAGVARAGHIVEVGHLQELALLLSPAAFTYVLSVLASDPSPETVSVVAAYESGASLRPLDALIVLHASRNRLERSEYIVRVSGLTRKLADDDRTVEVLAAVASELALPDDAAFEVVESILLSDAARYELKCSAIDYLVGLDSPHTARLIRRLRGKVRADGRLRKRLQAAEERLISEAAVARASNLRGGRGPKKGIEDQLWKALRI